MKTLVTVLLLALARPAHAEPLGSLVVPGDTGRRAVTATLGLDGAITANVGAAFGIARAGARADLVVWGDGTIALGDVDVDDMRARIGARITLYRRGPLFVHGSLAGVVRSTSSTGLDAQSVATELRFTPGVTFARRFIAAGEVSIEQAWATHLAPTPAYRDLVYAMATEGWYRTSARELRAGLAGAVRIRSVEISAHAGYAYAGALDYLPALYVTVEAARRF